MLIRISLMCLIFLLNTNSAQSEAKKKTVLPQQLKQILGSLPADSESLIVANGPISITFESKPDRSFLDTVRPLAFSLVLTLQNGLLKEHLQGETLLMAVEGCRRFTAPKSLGMMPYEGCQVLYFDDGSHAAVQAAVKLCFEKALKTVQLGETKAAVFTERWEQDQWTIFVAQPQPGVMLCATNQKYLEEVLARMHRKQKARAFPDELPEWQYVNLKASVWAMRHYSKKFVNADPSSPFKGPAAANVSDIGAIGFVFWFDPAKDQIARAIYLSKSKAALSIMKARWHDPEENLTPMIKEIKPGVIEVAEPVSGNVHDAGMFILLMVLYLGHGIYL